jgi:hypothetical protein
MLLPFD